MTNRELIMLLLNKDIDAEVRIEAQTYDKCDVSYDEAESVRMYDNKIYISGNGKINILRRRI